MFAADPFGRGRQHLRAATLPTRPAPAPQLDPVDRLAPSRLDWSGDFWTPPDLADEWLIEPLIARGRGHAIFAPSKAGKSLLLLHLAVMAATGRAVLDQPAGEPVRIVYCDHEMTGDDVRERLVDMGFSAADDLDRLAYYSLPAMSPLDTAEGGAELVALARHHDAALVIVDTLGRTLAGEENSADTLRAFYRHTGGPLKAEGRAVLRADHAGKDLEKGMRGTSAKADDVDIVWRMVPRDRGRFDLRATHRRMGWVPEVVHLDQSADPLAYRVAGDSWPAGTAETAADLDRLGVPVGAGRIVARAALTDAGSTARTDTLRAAIRYRRQRSETALIDLSGGPS